MPTLIDRIRKRVMDSAGDSKLPPPATPSEIAAAEARLGFKMPPLLKSLYTEIANGGFGPSQGFLGVPSRKVKAGYHLVNAYRRFAHRKKLKWPKRLLPINYLGCDVWFCIDCSDVNRRVIMFDSDLGGLEESDAATPRRSWPYPRNPFGVCFRVRSKSFETFLKVWLSDSSRLFRW